MKDIGWLELFLSHEKLKNDNEKNSSAGVNNRHVFILCNT